MCGRLCDDQYRIQKSAPDLNFKTVYTSWLDNRASETIVEKVYRINQFFPRLKKFNKKMKWVGR